MSKKVNVNSINIRPIERNDRVGKNDEFSYEQKSGYVVSVDVSSTEEMFGKLGSTRGIVEMSSIGWRGNSENEIPEGLERRIIELYTEIEDELNKR